MDTIAIGMIKNLEGQVNTLDTEVSGLPTTATVNAKADKTYVDTTVGTLSSLATTTKTSIVAAVNEHVNKTSNPHGVTASQVGAYSKAESDAKYNVNTHNNMAVCSGTINVTKDVETVVPYASATNWSAGIWTAPIAGKFMFNPTVYTNGMSGGVVLNVYKNNVYSYTLDKIHNPDATTYEFVLKGNVMFSVASGDTIRFKVLSSSSNGSTINGTHSMCTVVKVG